jgi:hypothetical protein
MLALRADELEEAARIIRSQLPHRNAIWITSMTSQNIGGDVSHFIHDIRRFEITGRTRDTTWGRAGDRLSIRRARNTMGYHSRRHDPPSPN